MQSLYVIITGKPVGRISRKRYEDIVIHIERAPMKPTAVHQVLDKIGGWDVKDRVVISSMEVK